MSRQIPQGIEVLVSKAAVDPEFKTALLETRAAAAEEIGLELSPAEAMMLDSVPPEQLEAIIARTNVPPEHRRAFLGKAAAAMLAAMAAMAPGMSAAERLMPAPGGIAPNPPPNPPPPTRGIQPDRPPKARTIEQRVVDIVVEQFKVKKEEVTRETSLVKDLKADARGLIQFHKQLEKQFAVKISDPSFKQMQTVGQTVEYLEKATKPPTPKPAPRPEPTPLGGVRPDMPPGGLGGVRPN